MTVKIGLHVLANLTFFADKTTFLSPRGAFFKDVEFVVFQPFPLIIVNLLLSFKKDKMGKHTT